MKKSYYVSIMVLLAIVCLTSSTVYARDHGPKKRAQLEIQDLASGLNINVPDNTSGVVIGTFGLHATYHPSTVTELVFDFSLQNQDGSAAQLSDISNVKLYTADGDIVSGPVDIHPDTHNLLMTDYIDVLVGENTYVLKADLSNDFTHNDHFSISLNSRNVKARDAITGKRIKVGPRGSLLISERTVKDAILGVSVSPFPASQSVAQNTSQFHTTDLLFDATDSAHNIFVTSVRISVETQIPADTSVVNNCILYEGTTPVPISFSGGGGNSSSVEYFYGIQVGNVSLQKGSTMTISVNCDVGEALGGSFTVGIAADSIMAVDSNGSIVDTLITPGDGKTMYIIP